MDADFAKDVEAAIDSPMYGHLDRNPHHHIPPDFQERSRLWMASATNLITENAPFIYTSVENLMFAERYILRMEKTLVRQSSDPQPLLLKECAAHSILWLCGLYEVIRVLKQAKSPKFVAFSDLHNKLHVLRIPLAKHEVSGDPGYRNTPHYPTSVWSAETGRVGWQAFNPVTNSPEVISVLIWRTNSWLLPNEYPLRRRGVYKPFDLLSWQRPISENRGQTECSPFFLESFYNRRAARRTKNNRKSLGCPRFPPSFFCQTGQFSYEQKGARARHPTYSYLRND